LLDDRATLRPNPAVRKLGPRPTLGELQRATPWVWLWCERCQHHAPLACAVAVIRRGPDASSDKLRAVARCTSCGSKGATVQQTHLERLRAIERHPGCTFTSHDNLAKQIAYTVILDLLAKEPSAAPIVEVPIAPSPAATPPDLPLNVHPAAIRASAVVQ